MGENKALLRLGRLTVIERIIYSVRPLCDPVFLVADTENQYRFLGLQVYPDIHKNSGPLAGIHSALSHAEADWVLILSCDLPFITTQVLRLLIDKRGEQDAIVLSDNGDIHPLCGVYHKRCLKPAEESLVRAERSVQSFLRTINTLVVDLSELPRISPTVLTNLNTPDDYRACLALIKNDVHG